MTPDEATWVREHVWTGPVRDTDARWSTHSKCPCNPCGYCSDGRHKDCYLWRYPTEALARYRRIGVPVTWVLAHNGRAAHDAFGVYDLQHSHGSWCTCAQNGHLGQLEPPEPDLLDHLALMEASP